MVKLKNLSKKRLVGLIKLDINLDNFRDRLLYPNHRDWFRRLICKQKDRLVNDSETINETIRFLGGYIRLVVERAIEILIYEEYKYVNPENIVKQFSEADYILYERIFDQELILLAKQNHPRFWHSIGVAYGQGVERGASDLGIPPEEVSWQNYRETIAFREKLFGTLQYITDDLGVHIKGIISAGVAEGLHPYDIARRIREVKNKPKLVKVPAKIKDGKVVRKAYKYKIPVNRYAEMVARTESSRAITEGRMDIYRRHNVQYVEWITAGDSRVCSDCLDLDGAIFEIDKAPQVPLHVDCRCDKVFADDKV